MKQTEELEEEEKEQKEEEWVSIETLRFPNLHYLCLPHCLLSVCTFHAHSPSPLGVPSSPHGDAVMSEIL